MCRCVAEEKFNSLVAFLRQHKHEKQLVFFRFVRLIATYIKFGIINICFNVSEKSSLLLTKAAFIWSKYSKDINVVKYYYDLK